MTCRERMMRVRLMEKMNNSTSNKIMKEDNNVKMFDKNGNILIEATLRKRA